MKLSIVAFEECFLADALEIWNEVIEEGVAFPQLDFLDVESGLAYFIEQSYLGLAKNEETGEIVGLYTLHPNNVGRCGHLSNASYAVKSSARGNKIGELLVRHSISMAKELGFRILQFNAVVSSNLSALHLYKKLGFIQLGTIPEGFLMKDGTYQDIVLHYLTL